MKERDEQQVSFGEYRGASAEAPAHDGLRAILSCPNDLFQDADSHIVSEGRHRCVRTCVTLSGQPHHWLIKSFARETIFKNRVDARRGSKALRTWKMARALQDHGIGTPEPVAYLEKWRGTRLVESYYISEYQQDVTSFRDELVRLYRQDPHSELFLRLMQRAVEPIRAMHDAGILHNDLGNQNIMLRRMGKTDWCDVQFIDLNRGRLKKSLTDRERGRDLSRISLPSDLLRLFHDMYWGVVPPVEFKKWEEVYRRRFAWHTRTRSLRHPIRELLRKTDVNLDQTYPSEKDMWIWDERSAQPMITMQSRERHRHYSRSRVLNPVIATVRAALPIKRAYDHLHESCYGGTVAMTGRIGMSVDPNPDNIEQELEFLDRLGKLPVLVRFYYHEGEQKRRFRVNLVRQLAERGHRPSIALIQNRDAVLAPQRWAAFVNQVLEETHDVVEWVELGHAINRVKWGIWGFAEYRRLIGCIREAAARFPDVRWIGPAVIDFDYPHLLAALKCVPRGVRFQALSHLLYVDRRGAPENRQGKFAALEKFALARAIARQAPQCEDRLIISEVNWPLMGQGIYSPVGSPYVSPGQRFNDPSVSEMEYADYMLRYLVIALCSGMVERVYWWRLVARGFGLVDDGDQEGWRERCAFKALRYFLSVIGDSTFVRKLVVPGAECFLFELPSGETTCFAYSTSSSIAVELPFQYREAVDSLGETVMKHTEMVPRQVEQSVRLSCTPIYFLGVVEEGH